MRYGRDFGERACSFNLTTPLPRNQYTSLFTRYTRQPAHDRPRSSLGRHPEGRQPGAGRAGRLGPGVGVHFKIDGADTGGALSVVEHPFDVGALVRPHVHTREDEISIVLEGEIGFRSEDQEVVLRPGGYIIKPRNQVHAMWNAGATPARMIEIISPAGFEGFFRGFADMNDAGPIDLAAVAALAQQYGLPYADPDWLPDVIARYNLTPPAPRPTG